MKKTSKNLTEGNVTRQLILLAVPILLSSYIQTLYNMVDAIVVGKLVGTEALAAITASADISNMLIAFFVGLSSGAGVMFSRYFGAKNYDRLNTAIHTGLCSALIFGLFLSLGGVILSPWLLQVVNCPSNIYGDALAYFRIYLIGIFLTSMYNVSSGVLQAVGDSKTPTKILLIASCCNIALDLVFVGICRLGVLGAALATVLSQAISLSLILRRMMRTEDVYRFSFRKLGLDIPILKEILLVSLPAALQSCLINFANIFIQRYRNSFGFEAVAGTGAANKIDGYVSEIAKALSLSMSIFLSQNVGAKKYARARQGLRQSLVISCCCLLGLGTPVFLLAPQILQIFTDSGEAIAYGTTLMRTVIPLYFLFALHSTFTHANRGLGYPLQSMLLGTTGLIGMRQLVLYLMMQRDYSIVHVYRSYPVGWFFGAALNIIFYLLVARKKLNKND